MKKTALLSVVAFLSLTAAARGQFHWINDLEKGLTDARDRDAPILAFFWEYN